MPQVLPPFGSADFSVDANRNLTVEIALRDQNCNWLSPPFTTGYFAIFTIGRTQPPLFERDTNGLYARFTLDVVAPVAGQWWLSADILPIDTIALPPGIYYYEARLDFAAGQYELRSGLFLLKSTYI